jgi:hypothetical protein
MDTYQYIESIALDLAYIAFGLALALIVAASACGFWQLVDRIQTRRWNAAAERHLSETTEMAVAENLCIDALQVLEDKVHHWRHNVHCPDCGRFSRQAEGWPPGVSDCRYHGIRLRVNELDTGIIPIVVIAGDAVLTPEPTSILEIEAPAEVSELYVETLVQRAAEFVVTNDLDEIIIWPEELEYSS